MKKNNFFYLLLILVTLAISNSSFSREYDDAGCVSANGGLRWRIEKKLDNNLYEASARFSHIQEQYLIKIKTIKVQGPGNIIMPYWNLKKVGKTKVKMNNGFEKEVMVLEESLECSEVQARTDWFTYSMSVPVLDKKLHEKYFALALKKENDEKLLRESAALLKYRETISEVIGEAGATEFINEKCLYLNLKNTYSGGDYTKEHYEYKLPDNIVYHNPYSDSDPMVTNPKPGKFLKKTEKTFALKSYNSTIQAPIFEDSKTCSDIFKKYKTAAKKRKK